jgi:hypothetical protein
MNLVKGQKEIRRMRLRIDIKNKNNAIIKG